MPAGRKEEGDYSSYYLVYRPIISPINQIRITRFLLGGISMDKKEVYEKHKKYLHTCVATYTKNRLSWIAERENMSMIGGKRISRFFWGVSPSSAVIVMREITAR